MYIRVGTRRYIILSVVIDRIRFYRLHTSVGILYYYYTYIHTYIHTYTQYNIKIVCILYSLYIYCFILQNVGRAKVNQVPGYL